MVSIPTGTVTFLFTDIEGSTHLWQAYPDQMKANLARHDALLREVIEQNEGYVFKTVGDAFCAAFPTALQGVKAAIEAQKALATENWGECVIKVRMGLHTGDAEERDNDYFGNTVNRVARLSSAGHGEQILLSLATQELVWDKLPEGVTLVDFGERRLKDLIRPERIFQLNVPGLKDAFPPLKTLEYFRSNLPTQLTSFIGREKEITEIKRLIAENRLTTLTGPGGTGKTRLSLQVAADLFDIFPDGVWFVELAPLSDPTLVLKTVTTTLGLREDTGRLLLDILTDYLREKDLLLILDNCEHLVEASAQLTIQLLGSCPKLHILASSREALGIPGEMPYRVPPLNSPDALHLPPLEILAQYESVRLFMERARVALPSIHLTIENAPAVAQICQRLDGIPLALELAAARTNLLKIEQIASRLDDAFRLLTGSSRTALPRHQTLRATIDWSYSLLSDAEQTLLRRLSVFAGGWTLEAAEAVCVNKRGKIRLKAAEILDLLTALVNKSLVWVEREPDQEARYHLLETIRQYVREKFSETNESGSVRDQHLAYFLDFARRAEPEVQGANQALWFDRLEMELANIRAALEWSLARGERGAENGLQIASSLWWFWFSRHASEGAGWMIKALDTSQSSNNLIFRANALSRLGWVDFGNEAHAEKGLALGQTLGQSGRESVATATLLKSAWAIYQADNPQSQALAAESLKIFRAIEHHWGICESLTWMGMALINQGHPQQAIAPLMESLARAQSVHDLNEIGFATWQIGRAMNAEGDYDRAITLFEEALAIYKEIKQVGGITFLLSDMAKAALLKGDYPRATLCYQEYLRLFWQAGNQRYIALGLEQIAGIAAIQHQPERSARLYGAAEYLREASGAVLYPYQVEEYQHNLGILHSQLDEVIFTAAWAKGRALTLERAVAFALGDGE